MNRLELFGGASAWADDRPLVGRAAQRHRMALLALLATTRRASRGRDSLAAVLWPDADTNRGRRLLSDSVYRINRALGGEAIVGAGDELHLNRLRIASDVAELEEAADARDWRMVVSRYRGAFLDGFFLAGSAEFDQWTTVERQGYEKVAARAMESLAREAAGERRLVDAVDWWQRLAGLVPDDSRVTTELMRALEAAGNRAGAIRSARVHAELLRDAFGIEPDRSVIELAERIAGRSEAVTSKAIHPRPRGRLRETLRAAGGV
jgi:DNA-binding SARP family transcriptional activator